MVKCYACNIKFNSEKEFLKHVKEEHNNNIEETIYETLKIQLKSPQDFTKILTKLPLFTEVKKEGSTLIIKKPRDTPNKDYYISTWNCHATLFTPNAEDFVHIGNYSIPKNIYSDDIRDELIDLINQVIEDRGGAINVSGIYYLDSEHLQKLLTIIKKLI